MSPVEIKSLGFKLIKSVPDSVEEFDRLAKEAGSALREATRNVLYRSTLAEFRNVFLHGREADAETSSPEIVGLDKLTEIDRKVKVTKPAVLDAEGKVTAEAVDVWAETEDEYFTRVCALIAQRDGSTVEAVQASFATQAQAVMDAIAFDPSKTERKSSGPKKIPSTYIEVAKEIVNAKGGNIAEGIAAFTRKTGLAVAGDTVEALAFAVWAHQKAQKKSIAAGYANA